VEAYSVALRNYQSQGIDDLRQKFREGKRKILYQLATGGGKTIWFSEVTRLAFEKGFRVWIIVPRKKLLRQSSRELVETKIPHGIINASSNESRAFKVHVVSKDTLIRRIKANKIKNWPDFIVWDETHLALKQQQFVEDNAPEGTYFLGVTATPKEPGGLGLHSMYEDIILGPKFSYLVECGFLSPFKYFCPPFDFKINKRGDDYDPKTIEEILKSRQVYGKVISHYKQHGDGKPTLVFCPSVKNSEQTAQRFRDSGYRFESINGTMPESKIEMIIKAFEEKKLDGITSCDLVTFGVNLPSIECIILLRKTMSLTLFFQMLGRGTRVSPGKEYCTILDHMGNFLEHAGGEGESISEKFDIDWEKHFYGTEKNKKKKGESVASLKLCPHCFLYYTGETCINCGQERTKPTKKYEEIDGRLIEIKGPIKLNEREPEERREIQDTIGAIKDRVQAGSIIDADVKKMLDIAKDIGRNFMWVYWTLSEGMSVVNIPVLHSMRRALGYKQGWVWMQQKTIENRLGR
jgi:superfamily II DNA or RNA helicase